MLARSMRPSLEDIIRQETMTWFFFLNRLFKILLICGFDLYNVSVISKK